MKKLMTKVMWVALIAVLIAGLFATSCATSAPSPTLSSTASSSTTSPTAKPSSSTTASPSPTSTSTSTSTSTQVINLRYADQNPVTAWSVQQAAQPWLDQIQKATNNRVHIDPYWSETLCKGVNAWDATKNGVADMAWMLHGNWANMTPLADVMTLPLLPFTSAKQASGILWQLYEKYPTLRDEFKDNHVLLTFTSQPYFLVTTKKQVKTLADWQGLKIRVTSGPPVDMLKSFGAVPVAMTMPDTYMNLQKGVLDGVLVDWNALISFRQYEVLKYYTYAPLVTTYLTQAMNNNKWNSLPKDIQDQINSVCGLKGSLFWGKIRGDDSIPVGQDLARKSNAPMEEYTVPADELAKWSAVGGQLLWDQWVSNMTAQGHPEAKDILNTTLDLIKTYKP